MLSLSIKSVHTSTCIHMAVSLRGSPATTTTLFIPIRSLCLVTQLYPALCDPMDCSLPGPSVHGILQARILEWIAISSPGDLPNPGLPHCRQILDHLFFFFFNFFKIYFNWKLITLQYCTGFCHTLTWISHGCTCVPHPEPPPTSLPQILDHLEPPGKP